MSNSTFPSTNRAFQLKKPKRYLRTIKMKDEHFIMPQANQDGHNPGCSSLV